MTNQNSNTNLKLKKISRIVGISLILIGIGLIVGAFINGSLVLNTVGLSILKVGSTILKISIFAKLIKKIAAKIKARKSKSITATSHNPQEVLEVEVFGSIACATEITSAPCKLEQVLASPCTIKPPPNILSMI